MQCVGGIHHAFGVQIAQLILRGISVKAPVMMLPPLLADVECVLEKGVLQCQWL